MKKIIALMTALSLCLVSYTVSAKKENIQLKMDDGTIFEYRASEDGQTMEVHGCLDCPSGEIIIPSEIDGKPVTYVGASILWDVDNVKKIYMPDTVTDFEDYNSNFYHLDSIEEIRLSDSITKIPDLAFRWFPKLKKVNIPKNVVKIGKEAFAGCPELTGEIIIPPSCERIAKSAFAETGITSLVIQDAPVNIDNYAFFCCRGLKTVSFGNNIESIGTHAFGYCEAMESVTCPKLSIIPEAMFEYCRGLKEVNISSKTREIQAFAFQGCHSLQKITIPSNVKTIGEEAFDCFNLTEVEGVSEEKLRNSWRAFHRSPWGKSLLSKDPFIIDDEGRLVGYAGTDKDIVLPDTVKIIGKDIFAKYVLCDDQGKPIGVETDIRTIVIPDSVEKIEMCAFVCSNLESVVIPGSVKQIEAFAFQACTRLKSLTFEEGRTPILLGNSCFSGCNAVMPEDIHINREISTASEDNAFSGTFLDPMFAKYYKTPEPEVTPKPTASPTAVPTATPKPEEKHIDVSSKGGDVELVIDSRAVQFPDAKPFIDESDRTQIPIRVLSELLGFEVKWEEESRTAVLTRENIVITVKIGDKHIIKNGNPIEMDTEAKIIGDRTYIPLRFIAEALGCTVEWK